MELTVNVEKIDLNDEISAYYDEDGDRVGGGTLADVIVRKLVADFTRTDGWKGVAERIRTIRDEEIRAQLAPVIAEALAKPMRKTNSYGEVVGGDTTLREVIADEARKWMNAKADNRFNDQTTNLQALIRAEVRAAFEDEIKAEVKAAREAVAAALGQDVGARITAVVNEALRAR